MCIFKDIVVILYYKCVYLFYCIFETQVKSDVITFYFIYRKKNIMHYTAHLKMSAVHSKI